VFPERNILRDLRLLLLYQSVFQKNVFSFLFGKIVGYILRTFKSGTRGAEQLGGGRKVGSTWCRPDRDGE